MTGPSQSSRQCGIRRFWLTLSFLCRIAAFLIVRQMIDQVTSRVWSHANTALWVLAGASLVSVVIAVLDYVQGLVLGDWSGVHPIYRLGIIPIRIVLAVAAAAVISAVAFLAHYPPLKTRSTQIQFGAACGLVTVSSLLGPWVSEGNTFFLLVFGIALPLIFWLRVRLVRERVA